MGRHYRRGFAILTFVAILDVSTACSYVEIPIPDAQATNGSRYVIGRTMELGNSGGSENFYADSQWKVVVHARGSSGGRHGFVSVDEFGLDGVLNFISEGMNELGLTISEQTLRESAYEATSVTDPSVDISSIDVCARVMANCGDVVEALAYLEAHRIVGSGGPVGLHWAIADSAGRSVVVEYLQGRRIVYENTPRVMTNDPPLDWHWRNLNSYASLSPFFPRDNDFLRVDTPVGAVPRSIGKGWNLFGLPGDGSPPSRFVQLFYLRGYSMRKAAPMSTDDAIVLATGLINKVFIPFGVPGDDQELGDMPEYTPWAALKIPLERRFLFRGYRDLRWRQVNLSTIDFSDPASERAWPIESGTLGIEDMETTSFVRV